MTNNMLDTFLTNIRRKDKQIMPGQMIRNTIAVFLLGIILGVFSKYLDYHQAELPYFIMLVDETLDLHNFLGRFPLWIFIAVCISVYSNSPIRAAIHVFVFFVGMVASYYMYSTFIAGFFPKSYAMIWAGFTIVSPFLAFICWYAKGTGKISLILASMICSVLFNMTFAYGWIYFDIYSILELIIFVCGLMVLRRRTRKENVIMIVLGLIIALILHNVFPFVL